MRALVTGAAGFIGSTLCARLIDEGWDVVGVDCFTTYYDVAIKRANVDDLSRSPRFEFRELDLTSTDLGQLLQGVPVIFHQAAQPGVRSSWADGFSTYVDANIRATQRLLEAARHSDLTRFVYASSSSVYGQIGAVEVTEEHPLHPFSPYGVTKLAAEHLCGAYAENFGVPTVSLRYFTVYGPRQRPDMALYRLIRSVQTGEPFPLYGSGEQIRDFTYVDDIVDANVRAASAELGAGTVLNVAGGSQTRLLDLVELVGTTVGREVPMVGRARASGDVTRTRGNSQRAREVLGWSPSVTLEEGVKRQVEYQLR